jgi:hypothetical protein
MPWHTRPVVKTGARAAALGSMLTAAGHKPADLKVPAPRVLDLPDELAERIREELEALGGDRDAVARLRPGSWALAFDDGLLVELDERTALQSVPQTDASGAASQTALRRFRSSDRMPARWTCRITRAPMTCQR